MKNYLPVTFFGLFILIRKFFKKETEMERMIREEQDKVDRKAAEEAAFWIKLNINSSQQPFNFIVIDSMIEAFKKKYPKSSELSSDLELQRDVRYKFVHGII